MVFSSISFLYYFLPLVFISYFLLPKKIKNISLLIASLVFYFYGESSYILLMLFSVFTAYVSGILIGKLNEKEDNIKENKDLIQKIKLHKKLILVIEIVISIGLLSIFKYADFFIKNINTLFDSKINLLHLALPIGISFYTFQTMSYVIDVYKKTVKPQKSIANLALYITFFPQLIAGPIVRYSDIENQFDSRKIDSEEISSGIRKFVIGLSKKVLLANNLALFCDTFQTIDERSIVLYWMYGIANCLYIYLDFSGYSDMAIGLARIFGFKFPENFNYPYIAKSITEFWRRWHISLSNWFRDYVYIPLGGSKEGILKTIRNILIVWLLTGMWHGANWNFIIWGLYFAIILIVEKLFLYNILQKMPSILSRIYTLLIVIISFVIFSGENSNQIFTNIQGLFGGQGEVWCNDLTLYYLRSYGIIFIISILASIPIFKWIAEKINKYNLQKFYIIEPIIIGFILIICTGYLVDNSFNPFLYFRF